MLQLSEVHWLLSLQTLTDVAAHVPPWHASPSVQGLPSSQVPECAVCLQPLVAEQVSSVQTLLSSQFNAPLPTQTPLTQPSLGVHKLPSEQGLPSKGVPLWLQLPSAMTQLSTVHGLPSSHDLAVAGTH